MSIMGVMEGPGVDPPGQRTLVLKPRASAPKFVLSVEDLEVSSPPLFSPNYFKTRGVIGRRETPWTGDTTNLADRTGTNSGTQR
jgi:hypothetical protein